MASDSMKRPFFYIALSLSTGIAIAGIVAVPILCLFPAAIIFYSLSLACKKSPSARAFLYVAIILSGMLLLQNSKILPPDHIANLVKSEPERVLLKGVIIDDPLVRTNIYGQGVKKFLLKAKLVKRDGVWRRISGTVMVDVFGSRPQMGYGDILMLEGELSGMPGLKNPGSFDYAGYMALRNIYGLVRVGKDDLIHMVGAGGNPLYRGAYLIRHRIRRAIRAFFGQEERGILEAIVTGDRTGLSRTVRDQFVKTGTVHILAISGLHVGLVAFLFLAIFKFFGIRRKARYLLVIPILALYVVISGSNPPVIRASMMFAIIALGYVFGRQGEGLNLLGLAAVLMLSLNPKELFDPSFQLSFVSVMSIILIAPRLFGYLVPKRKVSGKGIREKAMAYVAGAFCVSVAACIGTAPLVAYYFNIVSFVAIFSNIVIVPILFLLTTSLMAFLFMHAVSVQLARCFVPVISRIEALLVFANGVFLKIPCSYARVSAPPVILAVFYYAFLALIFYPGVSKRLPKKSTVLFFVLIAANIYVWTAALVPGSRELKATFLDVGHGDAAFIEFPDGGNMLIDGGSGGIEGGFDMGSFVIGPFLWNKGVRSIDAVVMTHPDEDHIGGLLYVLENFKVGCVIDNGFEREAENDVYKKYLNVITKKCIRRMRVTEGDTITGFGGVKIYVLNPPKETSGFSMNDFSLVVKVVFKDTSIIFCADIGRAAIREMAKYGEMLKTDIVKVPHHGGNIGGKETAYLFLTLIQARDAIISVGKRKRYGAPSDEMLDILTYLKSNIYETRKDGAVSVVSDGTSYKISGMKNT